MFKNHAFIYFLRPPSWSGTISPTTILLSTRSCWAVAFTKEYSVTLNSWSTNYRYCSNLRSYEVNITVITGVSWGEVCASVSISTHFPANTCQTTDLLYDSGGHPQIFISPLIAKPLTFLVSLLTDKTIFFLLLPVRWSLIRLLPLNFAHTCAYI